jgi:hypothetical protein
MKRTRSGHDNESYDFDVVAMTMKELSESIAQQRALKPHEHALQLPFAIGYEDDETVPITPARSPSPDVDTTQYRLNNDPFLQGINGKFVTNSFTTSQISNYLQNVSPKNPTVKANPENSPIIIP